jgi:hypothetical protein
MPFPSNAGALYIHPRVKITYGYWHATNENYLGIAAPFYVSKSSKMQLNREYKIYTPKYLQNLHTQIFFV